MTTENTQTTETIEATDTALFKLSVNGQETDQMLVLRFHINTTNEGLIRSMVVRSLQDLGEYLTTKGFENPEPWQVKDTDYFDRLVNTITGQLVTKHDATR